MNKTLALIAALGLVVSAPAFAADEDTSAPVTPAVKASTETPSKTETKKEKLAAKKEKSKEEAAKTEKAPEAAKLAPAAGGSKFDKSEKTDTQN